MKDLERSLLSAALSLGAIDQLITAGLRPEMLDDPEHRKVCVWAYEFFSTHGKTPGPDALTLEFPTWKLVAGEQEPIAFYIDKLRERTRYNRFQDVLAEGQDHLLAGDVDELAKALQRASQEDSIDFAVTTDEDITLDYGDRIEFYDDLRRNPGHLRGISTGFRTIDVATRGIQPSQFIVIGGMAKAGKSTLLMKMGVQINDAGYKVLMVSFEMSDLEQKSRHDAIRAEINYGKILTGHTTAVEMRKIRRALDKAANGYPFILTTDIAQNTTVSSIAAKIAQHSPDVVLLDGLYLMDDEFGEAPGSPQAITNITRGLHRLCLKTKVPIIGTTQALESKTNKRTGITSASIGYSSSYQQDCDVMLGLQQIEDEPTQAELRVLLSRSGPKVVSKLIWDWDTMNFSEVGEEDWDDDSESNQETKRRTSSF